jgi:uncharacterized membrane protein
MATKAHLRDLFFRTSVILKGLDGAIEIIGALVLWAMSPGRIIHLVYLLTQQEINKDPHDLIATHLRHAAANFTFATEHFMSFYLFGHGIVKLLLVVALLKRQVWAFPTAIAIFSGLVIYQIYRFTLTHSIGLFVLTVIDLVVIWFVWLEYRSMQAKHSAAQTTPPHFRL